MHKTIKHTLKVSPQEILLNPTTRRILRSHTEPDRKLLLDMSLAASFLSTWVYSYNAPGFRSDVAKMLRADAAMVRSWDRPGQRTSGIFERTMRGIAKLLDDAEAREYPPKKRRAKR